MAVILITHDLGVVAEVADEVAVMYGGRVVETGGLDDVFLRPQMPYTLGLLSSVPRLTHDVAGRVDPIPGNPPSPINLPTGCVFCPRCAYSDRVPGDLCQTTRPDLLEFSPGHLVRCHLDATQRQDISATVLAQLAGGQ
jgi:peptide/nickel transport system ATP-binding protein